jgi:hypothetical protein
MSVSVDNSFITFNTATFEIQFFTSTPGQSQYTIDSTTRTYFVNQQILNGPYFQSLSTTPTLTYKDATYSACIPNAMEITWCEDDTLKKITVSYDNEGGGCMSGEEVF